MGMKQPEMVFYYRGMIESSSGWIEGYSTNTENGGIMYPWYGKKTCQEDAKICGKKAVFVRSNQSAEPQQR